jgi:hypothetical protein
MADLRARITPPMRQRYSISSYAYGKVEKLSPEAAEALDMELAQALVDIKSIRHRRGDIRRRRLVRSSPSPGERL